MRKPLIAGNWKMNGSLELLETMKQALTSAQISSSVDVAIIPPFTLLMSAKEVLAGSSTGLGAQTLHPESSGAYTGEISASMLTECGVGYVLVGHSERRTLFAEDDQAVLARVRAALGAGLTPVLCIGETLEEREADRVETVVLGQVKTVIDALSAEERSRLVMAYEPVWAIGTGRTATPEQAQQVHAMIRSWLSDKDPALGEGMRLLYGGSMKADNAGDLLSQPDIDGGLIGGASLKPDDFIAICHAAG
ncbi:triose-phosphate isomerase [Kushneria indalinina]|uniref:Triosephosphate isomerase n=1 Tax=Kushneria indalinina DSM 14324 TaxID=1122140 RepID=A0A3D9DRU8_9GAMM|nr:triose-phosphate isomerase [Kushneria indalinina]REC93457.1 triosephosphate isomerase [Kushneria indalinina DSM 14324]